MRRLGMILAIAALVAAPASVFAAEPFSATLDGDSEVPPVTGLTASGTASVTISDDESEIAYEVTYQDLTGPVVAAHIHYGDTDEAGGVIFPLAQGASPFSGTLTEADFTPLDGGPQTFEEALAEIRAGMTYVNLHTEANPGGEIRGQLGELPDTDTAAATDLRADSGTFSVPLVLLAVFALALVVFSLRRFRFDRV